MELRVWKSFSCNNSSDFRLVARFADAKVAEDAAQELTKFFKTHAKQADAAVDDMIENDAEYPPSKPSAACEALGKKHGFKWSGWFSWGDDTLEGDEPIAVATEKTLVVYHSYCGGFPSEMKKYMKARGATKVEPEAMDAPTVSVLFKLPPGPSGKKLESSLAKLFAQADVPENKYIDRWKVKPPWSKDDQADDDSDNTAFFSDGKTAGFYIAIDPEHLEKLKKFLAKSGVTNPALRLCEEADLKKFKAIGAARCEACGSDDARLEYIDSRLHDITSEQLACAKCGGMYELLAFLKKKPKKQAIKKSATVAFTVQKTAKKAAKKKTAKKVAAKKKK